MFHQGSRYYFIFAKDCICDYSINHSSSQSDSGAQCDFWQKEDNFCQTSRINSKVDIFFFP